MIVMSNARVTAAQFAAMQARGLVPTEAHAVTARAKLMPVAFAPHSCRWSVTLVVPLKIGNGQNKREHHFARARRVKAERATVEAALQWVALPTLRHQTKRVAVTLTRLGGRKLDDDNNSAGMKAVRDEVSAWLGIDDGDELIAWQYGQRKSKTVGVEILIECEVWPMAEAMPTESGAVLCALPEIDRGTHTLPASVVFTPAELEARLAAHAARVAADLERIGRGKPDRQTRTHTVAHRNHQALMRAHPDVRVVDCAGCRRVILAAGQVRSRRCPAGTEAGRVGGRPYCAACIEEATGKAVGT